MSKKELLENNNEVIVIKDKAEKINDFRDCAIPENMVKDAFSALALSVLGEFFLSGDSKYFIFQGMLSNLEKMNYSEKEIEKFKVAVNEAIKKFHKPNDFMG